MVSPRLALKEVVSGKLEQGQIRGESQPSGMPLAWFFPRCHQRGTWVGLPGVEGQGRGGQEAQVA